MQLMRTTDWNGHRPLSWTAGWAFDVHGRQDFQETGKLHNLNITGVIHRSKKPFQYFDKSNIISEQHPWHVAHNYQKTGKTACNGRYNSSHIGNLRLLTTCVLMQKIAVWIFTASLKENREIWIWWWQVVVLWWHRCQLENNRSWQRHFEKTYVQLRQQYHLCYSCYKKYSDN